MEKQPKRNISVRIGAEEWEKLRSIARRESRTLSGQVWYWLRRCIRDYEATHGPLPPEGEVLL